MAAMMSTLYPRSRITGQTAQRCRDCIFDGARMICLLWMDGFTYVRVHRSHKTNNSDRHLLQ